MEGFPLPISTYLDTSNTFKNWLVDLQRVSIIFDLSWIVWPVAIACQNIGDTEHWQRTLAFWQEMQWYHRGVHMGSAVGPSPAYIKRYLQYNVLKIYYYYRPWKGQVGHQGVWQWAWHVVHVSRVMGAIRQQSRWIQHPEKPLFRPLAHACSSILSKVIFSRCDTWYTCLRPRGPPGDGLDGFSDPKNPYFDTSNMSVAQTNQKLASYSSAKYLWFMTGATRLQQGTTGCHRGHRG